MSRYIDADALAYIVASNGDADFINKVTKLMIDAPSIDIVRCRECRLNETDDCPMVYYNPLEDGGIETRWWNRPDDFCSWGEREERVMDETKVQIGEDVLLDISIHSDWYISAVGYDGEGVDVALRRKADRNKEWWLADTPQTLPKDIVQPCGNGNVMMSEDTYEELLQTEQTDCPWK